MAEGQLTGAGTAPEEAGVSAEKIVLVPVEREDGYRRLRATAIGVAHVPFDGGEHFEISLQSLTKRELSHRVGVKPDGALTLIGKNVRLEMREVAGLEMTRAQAVRLRADLARLLDGPGSVPEATAANGLAAGVLPLGSIQLALSELREEVGAETTTKRHEVGATERAHRIVSERQPEHAVPGGADRLVRDQALPRNLGLDAPPQPLGARRRGGALVLVVLLALAGGAGALVANTLGVRDVLEARVPILRSVHASSDAEMPKPASAQDNRAGQSAAVAQPVGPITPSTGSTQAAHADAVSLPTEPAQTAQAQTAQAQTAQAQTAQAQTQQAQTEPAQTSPPQTVPAQAEAAQPAATPPPNAPSAPAAVEPQAPAPDVSGAAESASAAAAPSSPERTPSVAAEAPRPAQDARPHLAIRARADTWVQVRDARGDTLLGRLLRAGETWNAPPRAGLRLTTGNAAGTEVLIDGVPGPSLGAPGTVRRDIALDDLGPH